MRDTLMMSTSQFASTSRFPPIQAGPTTSWHELGQELIVAIHRHPKCAQQCYSCMPSLPNIKHSHHLHTDPSDYIASINQHIDHPFPLHLQSICPKSPFVPSEEATAQKEGGILANHVLLTSAQNQARGAHVPDSRSDVQVEYTGKQAGRQAISFSHAPCKPAPLPSCTVEDCQLSQCS